MELSRQAQLLERLRDVPETRRDRIDLVRAAIASGAYDTEDRLGTAIERMLHEIQES